MHRSILTGTLIFAFSAVGFGIAAADPGAAPASPAKVSVAAGYSSSAGDSVTAVPAAPTVSVQKRAGDRTVPPAGARLAISNAFYAAPAARPAKPITRLRRFASGIVIRSSAIASSLTRSALRFIGTPYVFGGTRATGFDCSGYVQHVFATLGIHLPRTADAQYDAGRHIVAAMVPGDLVFFHTYAPGVSHVGIYLGNDKFIHSSSSHGVMITSLHNSYWAPRFLGAKRFFGS